MNNAVIYAYFSDCIIDVTGGRTASYAAITKNVAVKDLNLIFKEMLPL